MQADVPRSLRARCLDSLLLALRYGHFHLSRLAGHLCINDVVGVCGDTGMKGESLGAALAAGVGVVPCPLQKRLMIFTQKLWHT